jgi:hypothetical protein
MKKQIATRSAPVPRRLSRATTANNTSVHGCWHTEVDRLELAIARLVANRPVPSACLVSFFEVPGDSQLHVNVTHDRQTVPVSGWSGPAALPDGFVHNRRFEDHQSILPHVREMVFAERA